MSLAVGTFNGSADEWDAFARDQPGSTFCHNYAWGEVINRAFGHRSLWLGARDEGGGLAGILCLVRVRSLLFGDYLVSLPFLNYGGPLGNAAAVQALAAASVDLATRERVLLLELRSRIEQPLDLAVSHRKITVTLQLPGSADELMQAFPAKLRSQVRRPIKEGAVIRFGRDQVAGFYSVFARHMRDLGTPVMPRRFFELASEAFGDASWFGCAYLGDRPIAAGAGFEWNGELEMTWAASLTEFNRIAANMGLYWAFMERAVQRGLSRFNFGRCTPDGGTHRFKRQWGGKDEQLWWYQHSPRGGAVATPSPDGAYSWGPRLWKRLPLRVANLLGPRIVRAIP